MTNGLLGKKLGMTQIYDESVLEPVTVIEAGPCRVVAIKTRDRDGYEAVQLSFGEVKERKLSKAEAGPSQEAPGCTESSFARISQDGGCLGRTNRQGRHV